MEKIRVAALQIDLSWENPSANRKKIESMLKPYKGNTDLIVLPEMFNTGFTMNPENNFELMDGDTVSWMEGLAGKYKSLVMGSLIIKENGHYYNRMLGVGPEGMIGEYDKRHLFRMAGEDEFYREGKEWVLFEYKGWNICPMICYDLRFPVWSRNRVWNSRGLSYDLLVYVANWPAKRAHHWSTLISARSIENQAFTVGVNRVGTDGNNLPYTGNSIILDPTGEQMDYLEVEEGVLTATLEPEKLEAWREKFPIWKDADDFDLAV